MTTATTAERPTSGQAAGTVRTGRRPRVVIVGAGFGGLHAARALGNGGVDVLLLDRNNYHGFWPLLYQVATAGLEPEAIAYPVRAIVRRYANVNFLMAEVVGVDFERRLVLTEGPSVPYDYLILAAGSANNYFGNQSLAETTFGLKDIDDASRLRNQIISSFERAVWETDPARRQALTTVAVIGGGPTGVELAGALVELLRHPLQRDYPHLDLANARVILIEASNEILTPFPASLRAKALRRLQRMGVDVRLNHRVAGVSGGRIELDDRESLAAETVIWAAGVRAAELADRLQVERARGARVKVQPTLALAGHPEVFVVGDMSYLEGYKGSQPYPQLAPVAIQQGKQAARNILALQAGRPGEPFRYQDRGTMATIGRSVAIMDAYGLRIIGRVAWWGWLLVHLMWLIGFRNRLVVLANWAYNYFTYDRGVRLITRS
jgi:NADH dehydrogenase